MLGVILIAAVDRLSGYRTESRFVTIRAETMRIEPVYIADDRTVRPAFCNISVNEPDDFGTFRDDFQPTISQIPDPEHFGSVALITGVTEFPELLLGFFLLVGDRFILDLVFERLDQLLVELSQIQPPALALQDLYSVFSKFLIDK